MTTARITHTVVLECLVLARRFVCHNLLEYKRRRRPTTLPYYLMKVRKRYWTCHWEIIAVFLLDPLPPPPPHILTKNFHRSGDFRRTCTSSCWRRSVGFIAIFGKETDRFNTIEECIDIYTVSVTAVGCLHYSLPRFAVEKVASIYPGLDVF